MQLEELGEGMKYTLKHLARRVDADPYKLRRLLRSIEGAAPKGRWTWEEEPQHLVKRIQEILCQPHQAGRP